MSLPSRDVVFGDICRLLAPLNGNGIALGEETDIAGELSVDSAAIMDFVMQVEDHFDIEIPLNILSDIRTIGSLVDVVCARIADMD